MAGDQVLQRGGREEEFLAEAEFLAGIALIAGIEDAGDGFGADAFALGALVVAAVESVELQRGDGAGGPEAERVGVATAAADDGRVVGDGEDLLAGMPGEAGLAVGAGGVGDVAAEADAVGEFGALELPRVAEGEPILGQFLLHAVLDLLLEQAVLVADAVAERVDLEGRHALHEAGGEAAEAAIAQRGVGLALEQVGEVDALLGERLLDGVGQAEIADGVGEQAADEEFER